MDKKSKPARRPRHISAENARLYVLDCAISDRRAYLDAISNGTDEESMAMQAETRAELAWFAALRASELARIGGQSGGSPDATSKQRGHQVHDLVDLVDVAAGVRDLAHDKNKIGNNT